MVDEKTATGQQDPFPGWENLMGNDLLLKTISDQEEEERQVQPQDAVIVNFVGRLAENPHHEDGTLFHEAHEWVFVIGEKDVLPALEMGIRFMKVGETAAVWSSAKFAYGPGQRKMPDGTNSVLPPNSNVMYRITLKDVIEDTNDPEFQLRLCKSRKEIGNDVYKNDYIQNDPYAKSRALHLYQRSVEMLEHLLQHNTDAIDVDAANNILVDCLNNIAAVHMTCKAYHEAKNACVDVLQRDPNNGKALLRAAKAALEDPASSYEEVDAAIAVAEETGNDTTRLRALVKRKRSSHAKKTKKMYSSMAKGVVVQPKATAKDKPEAPQVDPMPRVEANVDRRYVLIGLVLTGLFLAMLFYQFLYNQSPNQEL